MVPDTLEPQDGHAEVLQQVMAPARKRVVIILGIVLIMYAIGAKPVMHVTGKWPAPVWYAYFLAAGVKEFKRHRPIKDIM